MAKEEKRGFLARYRRGLQTSIRNNSAAFGYSLVATADFAALNYLVGPPGLKEIHLFILGAVGAFVLMEAWATNLFKEKARGEPTDVVVLGSAFGIFSINAAVATASLIAWLIQSWIAWPCAGFASSTVYLALVAAEMAVAERAEKKAHDDK